MELQENLTQDANLRMRTSKSRQRREKGRKWKEMEGKRLPTSSKLMGHRRCSSPTREEEEKNKKNKNKKGAWVLEGSDMYLGVLILMEK